MNAKDIFLNYAGRFDRSDGKIELKIIHTFAVAEVMDRITMARKLTERQRYLAHLCAMFHDIGRFEQVKRYHTFMDHLSIDHARLGCEVLEEEGILKELAEKEQKRILTAIANHNRFQIEEGLDEETLLLCKLIRDADKCDIFRMYACENMLDAIGETEQQVACETISESVYQSVMEHRCVKKEERKTGLDIWISFLAFFFDLYFKESMEVVMADGYYRQPFDRVTFTDPETERRVRMILKEAEDFAAEVLA